jgi:hypothetical protein
MWAKMFGLALPSLVGSAIGTAAALVWLASMDLFEGDRSGKAQAMSSLIEAALAAEAGDQDLDRRHSSRMTTFASGYVVRRYIKYAETCADPGLRDEADCRRLWVSVIRAMREELGNDPLRERDVVTAVWGPDGRPAEDSATAVRAD